MFPENVLDFGSLKRHFLHFEDTFEQNIKVSNHIIIRLSHHIFKKYFGPNEIILTLSVSLHEIAKLDMVDVTSECNNNNNNNDFITTFPQKVTLHL